jgi:dCTP deaminase
MILTGPQIESAVGKGDIVIRPFRKRQLNPNSYDFRLGDRCCIYKETILDSAKEMKTQLLDVSSTGIILQPDRLYLFNTQETMGSKRYVPIIRGRSSVGRLGIFINITADLIDLGSINQWTLQLHSVQPVRVYPGMLIGQVTFWRTHGRRVQYDGKYRGRKSPVPSLSYLDKRKDHA